MTDQHPSGPPDNVAVADDHDIPATGTKGSVSRVRAGLRSLAMSYWGRLAGMTGFCHLFAALAWVITTTPPTIPTLVSMTAVASVLASRSMREYQIVHRALVLFSLTVMLPVAITVGTVDYWTGFGWPLVCAAIAWSVCLRARRNEKRCRTIWLTEPTGRQVLLDSQPFRCPRCDRVHHAVFASGEPLRLAEFPPDLHVEPTGRHRKNAAGRKRIHIIARFTTDDTGAMWLGTRPEEFVPDPERCFAFAVQPARS